ncbi:hypothetical protein BDK61_4268 [Haloarcula quadrata]|uniref:Uncharacterized protein n=1 Tax=Haloarcula quadrata TaxID=182779 RepID=A0A495QQH9_9EURY|nr:hypothetical protein BDK61_4268 [Haloarcula quadrata]
MITTIMTYVFWRDASILTVETLRFGESYPRTSDAWPSEVFMCMSLKSHIVDSAQISPAQHIVHHYYDHECKHR